MPNHSTADHTTPERLAALAAMKPQDAREACEGIAVMILAYDDATRQLAAALIAERAKTPSPEVIQGLRELLGSHDSDRGSRYYDPAPVSAARAWIGGLS